MPATPCSKWWPCPTPTPAREWIIPRDIIPNFSFLKDVKMCPFQQQKADITCMKTGEGQRRHNAKGECSCLMSKYVSATQIKESLDDLYWGKYLRFFHVWSSPELFWLHLLTWNFYGRKNAKERIWFLNDTSARILSGTPATWLTLDLKTASYIRTNLFNNQAELQPLECQFLVSLGSQFAPKKKIESVTTSFSQASTKVPFFRLNKDQTLV